jgi:ribosomal protein S10
MPGWLLPYGVRLHASSQLRHDRRAHRGFRSPTDKTIDALMKLDLAAGVDVQISVGNAD